MSLRNRKYINEEQYVPKSVNGVPVDVFVNVSGKDVKVVGAASNKGRTKVEYFVVSKNGIVSSYGGNVEKFYYRLRNEFQLQLKDVQRVRVSFEGAGY